VSECRCYYQCGCGDEPTDYDQAIAQFTGAVRESMRRDARRGLMPASVRVFVRLSLAAAEALLREDDL